MKPFEISFIIVILSGIGLIIRLVIELLLFFRMKKLTRDLERSRYMLSVAKQVSSMGERNQEFEALFKRLSKSSFSMYAREAIITTINSLHTKITEVEYQSRYEPRWWWPQKYQRKFALLREEARELALSLQALIQNRET